MKVAVVTPYYKETKRVLKRCITSVAKQTYDDVIHVLVSDGYPQDWVSDCTLHHLVMPNTGDCGDTPRLVGSAYASALGCDAIVLLDADCWMDEGHIAKLIEAQQVTGAGIVTCPRNIFSKFNNEYFGVDKESDGVRFNDTNCYFIIRPVFRTLANWAFKPMNKGLIGDRFFWEACLRAGVPIARTTFTAVNYPSDFVCHFEMFGKEVPGKAKMIEWDGEKFVHVLWKDKK